MKGSTIHAKLEELGVTPSHSRARVSNDNAYSESLFRTCKYHPAFPVAGFADLTDARKWVGRKRSISSIIVRSRAFRHRIGVEQIPENRECQMERKGIRLTGNLIWSRSPAKGSAPRLTPNVRVLPSPDCIICADV